MSPAAAPYTTTALTLMGLTELGDPLTDDLNEKVNINVKHNDRGYAEVAFVNPPGGGTAPVVNESLSQGEEKDLLATIRAEQKKSEDETIPF